MDLKKFVYLFMACNCNRDCYYIDLDYFNDYLYNVFCLDYDEVDNELKSVINEMQKENYVSISLGFEYLVKVNNNFPYKEIMLNNKKFIKTILMYIEDYNSYVFTSKKIAQNNGQVKIRR